jgi:hypothetical protein
LIRLIPRLAAHILCQLSLKSLIEIDHPSVSVLDSTGFQIDLRPDRAICVSHIRDLESCDLADPEPRPDREQEHGPVALRIGFGLDVGKHTLNVLWGKGSGLGHEVSPYK